MLAPRLSSLVLLLAIGLTGATGIGCAGDATSEEDPMSEENFTVDIKKSEELLAKAVSIAERHAAGKTCDEDGDDAVYLSNVVNYLRKAIAVRNTVWFRTRVIAKKEILAKVLAGTLAWQEIVGNYDPNKLDTLPKALATGVSIWDTNGGAYGNQKRIELRADGKATIHTLDIESKDYHWNQKPATWSYTNARLTVGGVTYRVEFKDGLLFFSTQGADFPEFISEVSECSA